MESLEKYRLMADAVAKLFAPHLEVVIHDLRKNQIAYLVGGKGLRKTGDSSHFSQKDLDSPVGIMGPYEKTGERGEKQKSISVVLPGDDEQSRYMFCLNFHIGEIGAAVETLSSWLATTANQKPAMTEHFTENWQDRINTFIEEFLRTRSLSMRQLDRQEKKQLVLALKRSGAFDGKHAAQYIADSLKIARSSVYSYIKQEPSS